jgi:hypothetical protein
MLSISFGISALAVTSLLPENDVIIGKLQPVPELALHVVAAQKVGSL